MIKAIVVALLAISATRQACDVGCLKCNSSGDCLIPDILNSYYLNGTTATKVSLTNCTLNSFDGKCVSCSSGYYLDSATNKCVAVATSGLITNCATYSSATSCSFCNSSYYLSNNACVAVETKISNCDIYSGASACSFCSNGYLLSLDNKSCVATPSISNCGDFTFVKCNTCDSGYVLNPNNYLSANLIATSAADRITLAFFAYNLIDSRSQSVSQNACQVESTANCALFDQGTNTCTQCSSGYYLDATTVGCIVFPDEPIENCLTYTSVNVCSECIAGHYFKSSSCTQITGTEVITNCTTYNGKASSVQCLTCNNNFFLSSNSCTARNVSADNKIANCATKENAADKCATCASGFVLASDGGQCFTVISNCATYVSTATGLVLKCNACNSSYYLTNTDASGANSCQQGTVENCSVYPTGSGTTCNTCANKYYLSGNTCVAHVNIDKCTTYNTNTANYCSVCTNPGYFNFSIAKNCQTLATGTINNCATYSGDLTAPQCATCNSGFYLNSNSCLAVEINFCLALDASNDCSLCASGYYLAANKKLCIAPPAFVTDNCLLNNTVNAAGNSGLIDAASCSVCQNGAVPFNLNKYYGCITTAEAAQFKTATLVDGCVKYNNDMKCVQCDLDKTKPNLDTVANLCLATCETGIIRYIISTFNGGYNIEKINVCRDNSIVAAITDCELYALNLDSGSVDAYICIKCKSAFLNIVNINEAGYSNVDPAATNLNSYFPSAFAKYPSVTCEALTTTNVNGSSSLIANCSYYLALPGSNNTCYRCNMGYQGTNGDAGTITACNVIGGCSSDRYYNLHPKFNNLATCHKCNNSSNIPFLAYNAVDSADPEFTGFSRYNLTRVNGNTYIDDTDTINSRNIECRSFDKSTFAITSTNYAIDTNCGLGVLNINSDGDFVNGTAYGTFCAACKPGFKPTAATIGYIQATCTAIVNCSTNSNYFNACSSCNTGFILKYDNTSGNIDFTACLSVPTATSAKFNNCMAALPVDATTTATSCKICKTGYFLNSDNVCDKYAPVNCLSGYFNPIQTENGLDITLDWSLWLNSNSVGCSKCSDNFVAYQFITAKATCVRSDWVAQSVDTQTSTNYITNCKNYNVVLGVANLRNCNTCNTNYVPSATVAGGTYTEDNASCFINTSINNCAVASSAALCVECKNATYSLKSNKCELGNIANCVAYNYNDSKAAVTCVTCAPDYYLDTAKNTCVMGEIYNCKVLTNNSSKSCTTCADGYVNVGGGLDNYHYCYPKDSSLGCNQMNVVNDAIYNGGQITCTSCTSPASQLVGSPAITAAKSICMAHAPVSNCKSFNIGSTLSTSNFLCSECNAGFYLNSNKRCVARVNQPAKCSAYTVTDDTCSKCDNTSYLANSSKNCVDYPKGILGCRTYSNAITCTACKDGRYLSNNVCPKVTTAITNCFYYSSNTTCSTCGTGYALINNACVKATANNCATYTSDTVCATCPSGSVLQTTNSITSCISLTKTGCSVINIISPYECTACTGSYYLESGECKAPTAISNCGAYATKTTCSRCNKGYALSADKTSCVNSVPTVSYVDSQCIDSQVVSTPACSRCSPGYYFITGACTGTCNTGSASGCLACDPKKATTCYVCKSGYYQSKDGVCNINNPAESNAMIMGILTAMIALISLIL